MSSPIKYTLTNESISFVFNGNVTTVKAGAPNFKNLRSALLEERWKDVPGHMTKERSVDTWGMELSKKTKGKFHVKNGEVYSGSKKLHNGVSKRIAEMSSKGESVDFLLKFWDKVQLNPSKRSVDQLWDFLQHSNIPITKDGNFLAYKSVQRDYKDHHSNTYDNSPGVVNEMPRNEISDDPREACHEGFHVGAIGYANSFGSGDRRIVVCEIDPANVVSVPYDASSQKIRVCKYKVIGNYSDDLGNTVHDEEVIAPEKDAKAEKVVTERETARGGKATTTKYAAPKGWDKFHKLGLADLMEHSLDELRQYASKGLLIVGASKIAGGKTALVAEIFKARKIK